MPDKDDAVSITPTAAYGPRMSMCAFVDFAYAAPLNDPDRVRGTVKPAAKQASSNQARAASGAQHKVRQDEDLTV